MATPPRQRLDRRGAPDVRVPRALGLLQLGLAALTLSLFGATGLSVDVASFVAPVVAATFLVGLGVFLLRSGDRAGLLPLSIGLLATCSLILSPAQYVAVAFRQPLIDPWLAALDERLGIHVPTLAAWTRAHPTVSVTLTAAYFSLLPQFIVTPIALHWLGHHKRAWEFLVNFHICGIITVSALAAFPAACAFQHYGFESTLDQSLFLSQFNGTRQGTLAVIDFNQLQGLISVPSFHVAGGLSAAWALRGLSSFPVSIFLNGVLTSATFMSGAHYGVDVPITVAMLACVFPLTASIIRRLHHEA